MKYDITTIGSASVDQFADTESELIRIETPTTKEKFIAFPLGSKILMKELKLSVGGGGTNTAVAFARLGFKTAYLGKIGKDSNGDFVVEQLQKESIDFIGPRAGQTGLSIILNSFAHDRTILVCKGANNDLQPQEVIAPESPWVYLSSMLGDSFTTVQALLSKNSYRVAFNPSNYQAEKGYEALMPLLEKTEILIMNMEEGCKFMGFSFTQRPPVEELLKALATLPPKMFILTDGPGGVHLYDRSHYCRAYPAEGLDVLETTGAGDAFAATFTAMIMKQESIERAVHLAMTNAESVLQHQGAKEKLLSYDELIEAAAALSRKIELRSID